MTAPSSETARALDLDLKKTPGFDVAKPAQHQSYPGDTLYRTPQLDPTLPIRTDLTLGDIALDLLSDTTASLAERVRQTALLAFALIRGAGHFPTR